MRFLRVSEAGLAGLIGGVLLAFPGVGIGETAAGAELSVHRDIPYAAPPEGVPADRLTLDVFTEDGAEGRPIVVFFHGGGVDSGDKRAALSKPARFVAEGYVFVSANRRWVRMPGPGDWLTDSANALAWVRDHIADHGGDPSRIFLMGHSAGAALAALLVTDERHLERGGMRPGDIRAVSILDTGGIDKLRQKREAPSAPVVRLYAELGLDDRMLAETSAINFIAPDKGIPPMILHCGGARRICAEFAARLTAIGVDAEDYDTHGASHSEINRDLGKPGDRTTEEILSFFARHGGVER